MDSRSYIIRQTEVGEITHNGHTFANVGSSVSGRNISGYLNKSGSLDRWNGLQLLSAARYVQFAEYWHDFHEPVACGWKLKGDRWIVGYALGDGMLFRGELADCDDESDAKRQATNLAAYWSEIDREDEERDQEEMESERWDGME